MFVRAWGFLRTFRELVLGPLGLHFGSSEVRLGTILGSLGTSWVPFWGLGSIFGALGLLWCLWGSLGAPLAAQGAHSQTFKISSLLILAPWLWAPWARNPIMVPKRPPELPKWSPRDPRTSSRNVRKKPSRSSQHTNRRKDNNPKSRHANKENKTARRNARSD